MNLDLEIASEACTSKLTLVRLLRTEMITVQIPPCLFLAYFFSVSYRRPTKERHLDTMVFATYSCQYGRHPVL